MRLPAPPIHPAPPILVGLLLAALCPGSSSAQPLSFAAPSRRVPLRLQTQLGSFAGAKFGIDVTALGDLNGDGHAEWMVGRGGKEPNQTHPELRVFSGRDGALLYDIDGFGNINTFFLESLADLGDVDGDGVNDFAFGNSNAPVNGRSNTGVVAAYSGRTGQNIYIVQGLIRFGGFGASLAPIGDVNGDQRPDFAVGQLGTLDENAWVVSGADGAFLFGHRGPQGLGDIEYGYSAAATGDLDGDGLPDFAMGTHSGQLVEYVSGGTGALLRTVTGGASFGTELADLGDIDGDGFRDLLVNETAARLVHILSGADGSTLATLSDPNGVNFGSSLAGVGDLDQDQVPDFLVGDDGYDAGRGRVRAYSTARLVPIFELVGTGSNDHLGAAVSGGRDFNADGWPDLATGSPGADAALPDGGQASIWSGRTNR